MVITGMVYYCYTHIITSVTIVILRPKKQTEKNTD